MTVSCEVFIDGSMTGTHYTFEALPRPGDKIQIGTVEKDWTLTVQSIVFVAAGVYGKNPAFISVRPRRYSAMHSGSNGHNHAPDLIGYAVRVMRKLKIRIQCVPVCQ